jgi:hypothetical protein
LIVSGPANIGTSSVIPGPTSNPSAADGLTRTNSLDGENSNQSQDSTVSFDNPEDAARAFSEYNHVLIDGKPIKVEVVGTVTAGETESLADRIA